MLSKLLSSVYICIIFVQRIKGWVQIKENRKIAPSEASTRYAFAGGFMGLGERKDVLQGPACGMGVGERGKGRS